MMTLLLKRRHNMMTLHLRRCVSLFVCLSLLVSACSPNKSSKAGNKMLRQGSDQGLVVQSQDTDKSADGPRWYKPTWYTVTTELGVGIGAGETLRRYFIKQRMNTKVALLLYGTTIGAALVAGEAARAVTTGFDMGPVGGGFAEVGAGIVTGGLMGVTICTTIARIMDGNFDGLSDAITIGGVLGGITGGISGLLTGIETGLFAKRPKKLDKMTEREKEKRDVPQPPITFCDKHKWCSVPRDTWKTITSDSEIGKVGGLSITTHERILGAVAFLYNVGYAICWHNWYMKFLPQRSVYTTPSPSLTPVPVHTPPSSPSPSPPPPSPTPPPVHTPS
jgi:hypothetical protein